jgi:hypothetical protein
MVLQAAAAVVTHVGARCWQLAQQQAACATQVVMGLEPIRSQVIRKQAGCAVQFLLSVYTSAVTG